MKTTMEYNGVLDSLLSVLSQGGTMLYPTDTIWGIGCDATNASAVDKIYDIKQRDHSKSMLILCSDLDMVERFVGGVGEEAARLLLSADRPTTVILPMTLSRLANNLAASDGSIGVRIPRMEFCQNMLRAFGRPIVSTSANFSGSPSPSSFSDIDSNLIARVDFCVPHYFDRPSAGTSSRILKLSPSGDIQILRP